MTALAHAPSSTAAAAPAHARKDKSQDRQKTMLAEHFHRLAVSRDTGEKNVQTFVPGNLTELIRSFDLLPVLPEINALQAGMRQKSGDYIQKAEKLGHSEDVCAYVKCDIGQLHSGNLGPTGEPLPSPDLLLLSYTGCFTFLKWFELIRHETKSPITMLHVPYQADGKITPSMREYVVKQIKETVIPALERVSGRKYDEEKLRDLLRRSARAEEDLVYVLESAKRVPSPIDGYFAAVYYVGPIFSAFRGTEDAVLYYRELREEIEERIRRGEGPTTPDGPMGPEKFRLVVEGPPNWTHFREFWKMFHSEGAVIVASTYSKVGGVYDNGFRHDPDHPLETMADYCMGCYTNLNFRSRIDMLCRYMTDYAADGLLIHSIKSCNSFSAGQLLILREVEARTGKPGGFFESDLVDPRYFSPANVKNRIESYLQMLEQKKSGGGHAR
ncbi:MAG: benzoyl-CoA reductase subunit B [Planctomycetes bacterium]|nr:benzoyl-CoA reductase subunit B [Planctomycetota bacterium]